MQHSYLRRYIKPEQFQSSPVPEDGCNRADVLRFAPIPEFQSSPVPEDGCNQRTLIPMRPVELVSILTRPGGRVQPRGSHGLGGPA